MYLNKKKKINKLKNNIKGGEREKFTIIIIIKIIDK